MRMKEKKTKIREKKGEGNEREEGKRGGKQ